MTTRVLFLMSDTGGGHRAACEAIRDALCAKYGESEIEAELLDVYRLAHFPINMMPEIYPWFVNHVKDSYGFIFNSSNTQGRAAMLARTFYMLNAQRLKQMTDKMPVDVVVSAHSVLTRPSLYAWRSLEKRPPFITVVTDLVSTHYFWYDTHAEFTLLPTQVAYDRGLECNMLPEKMKITGHPVNPAFLDSLKGQATARKALNWDQEKVTVLMVAGTEGMGPLYETAWAINNLNLDIQLVIVAGRNRELKDKLDATEWNQLTHIYPFVKNMPELMDAADIIVTKAGPATITEAAIAGLPIILMDAIPGQEEGNVSYVIENDAGAWAPEPQQVASVLQEWLHGGQELLQQKIKNAKSIARPEAVWEIADTVMEWAKRGPIQNPERGIWKRSRRFVSMTR